MFKPVIQHIRDLHGTPSDFIPLHAPVFIGNEKNYLEACIDSTFVSSVGKFVDDFEKQLAIYSGANKAVALSNGTAALQLALNIAGVKQGDEVITQALTFIATCNAIAYNGGTPIFVDVDYDTMGLSPDSLKQFLEEFGDLREDGCYNKKSGSRIAACLPMHTFGLICRIEEIRDICKEWKILMIEDAAEAIGSTLNGKMAGTFGTMGSLSFNGNKIITAGGGGAIITNDEKLSFKAKHMSTTAKVPHPYEYVHDELGYNFRMPNINAALALAQLELLDSFIEKKRELATSYMEFFEEKGIEFKRELDGTRSNYWLGSIALENTSERDQFLKETNEAGVMTRPIWQLMFRSPMYKDCQRDAQRNALRLEEQIVCLPSSVIL